MNCRGWNSHIALYVEGDLERDLVRDLEKHLAGCDECRGFAEDLRQSQVSVRELRAEIVDNASMNRVRDNVLSQVRVIQERRTWLDRVGMFLWSGLRWRYAVLGSAALILVTFMAWRLSIKRVSTVPAPPQIALSVPVPAPVTQAPAAQKPAAAVTRTVARSPKRLKAAEPVDVTLEKPNPPDTVVQLITDDPNVVIYWLIEQTGGM